MRSLARMTTPLLAALLATGLLFAQTPPSPQSTEQPAGTQSPEQTQSPPAKIDEETRLALDKLAEELVEQRQKLREARKDDDKDAIARLSAEVESREYQFAKLTARMNVREFEKPSQRTWDLQKELEQLVRPLLRALNDATEGPRELTELKARRDQVVARKKVVEEAFRNTQQAMQALAEGSPARVEAQRELDERWRPMLEELGSEFLVLNAAIQQREDASPSLWETVSEGTSTFVEEQGITLLLCIAVFTATWILIGFVGRRLLRLQPRGSFSRRLGELMLRLVAGLVALAATMIVLYTRNDMFLLAIAFVFLLGVGWVIAKTAPQFLEQIRLVLNVGAVREGERMIIDGIPYRVEALRFYSRLENPMLQGGRLRIPLKELIDERSRPVHPDEPWFPCAQGDVVMLSDGTVGMVHLQTPEVVTVAMKGLPQHNIPTRSFLQLNPRNLSGGFELRITFGVDYRHQADILTTVPEKLAASVERALEDDPDKQHVRGVKAAFNSAGSSSLDLLVFVALDGAAALRYWPLTRLIHQALVRACNEHGFGIPFPQLTVHQAGRADTRPAAEPGA